MSWRAVPTRLRRFLRQPHVTPAMIIAFVVAVALAAVGVPLALVAVPYIPFFNDMAMQAKVKPQMVWTVRDGVPLPGELSPPAGTLPRGWHDYPFPQARVPLPPPGESDPGRLARLAAQDAVAWRAGAALQAGGPAIPPEYVPPRPTLAAMARGQKKYNDLCIVCHGPLGLGDGRVPPRGFPPPPSLLDRREREFTDGRIFHTITNGQGAMPSYAHPLPPVDRWAVVHFVRALQKAMPEPVAAASVSEPPSAPARPAPPPPAAPPATPAATEPAR